MVEVFKAERDEPCRATILYSVGDRPVAYEEHWGKPISILHVPDITKRYLIELWGLIENKKLLGGS